MKTTVEIPDLLPVLGGTPELCLPVIVLGEYRYGISSSRYHAKYKQWLARDLSLFRILEVSEATTIHYSEIRSSLKAQGTPIRQTIVGLLLWPNSTGYPSSAGTRTSTQSRESGGSIGNFSLTHAKSQSG